MIDFNSPPPKPEKCIYTECIEPAADRLDKEYFVQVIIPHLEQGCQECHDECVRVNEKVQKSLPPRWLGTASRVASVVLLGFHLLYQGSRGR